MVPALVAKIPAFYVGMSRDPLIGGAMGFFGDSSHFVWFKSFLMLEACVFNKSTCEYRKLIETLDSSRCPFSS